MQGLVTDVAIKRKVRDFVDVARGREEPLQDHHVQGRASRSTPSTGTAYEATNIKPTGSKQKREDVDLVRAWMCDNFYDIRTFGAVMKPTKVNCGQVRGRSTHLRPFRGPDCAAGCLHCAVSRHR